MKTEALFRSYLRLKSDAVVFYSQNPACGRSLQLDHDLPGSRVFVGVNHRFARDAIKVCRRNVIAEME